MLQEPIYLKTQGSFELRAKYVILINCAYLLRLTLYFSRSELEYGALSESPIYKKIKQEGVTP